MRERERESEKERENETDRQTEKLIKNERWRTEREKIERRYKERK